MPIRVCARLLVACLAIAPCALRAQGFPVASDSALRHPDSLSTVRLLDAGAMASAPVDSATGLLLFLPGVSGTLGGLSIRGSLPGSDGAAVNGLDVTPALRGPAIPLPTLAIDRAWLLSGPRSARDPGNRVMQFEVPGAPRAGGARASYASDALTGAPSLGFHRFEASGGASGRSSRLFVGATLTGQKSADFGIDARDVPLFAPAGLDTTVAFAPDPSRPGDLTSVSMPRWAVTRGQCSDFAASADPVIASNAGQDCQGDRAPASARSEYRVALSGQYDVNPSATVSLTALKSRTDTRIFDYASLNTPANLRGTQQLASVYAITLAGHLGRNAFPGAYRLGVSRQHNQQVTGPLTAEGEAHTRDPALGLMLGGLDFRWDFESFPVDSALVANYRFNRPGTRISPFTAAEAASATLHDDYRDGPYALHGFADGGGPAGLVELEREARTTGFIDVVMPASARSTLALGGFLAHHEVTRYRHGLGASVGSDVWIEHPGSGALYAEQRFDYDAVQLALGVRYDFFHSNADRTTALDTLAFLPGSGGVANPGYGTYYLFPRPASYSNATGTATVNGQTLPLTSTTRDASHHAWSPRARASIRVGRGTVLRAGAAREVRLPDLRLAYLGVNTDLGITTTSSPYGSDLDFERSWTEELGLRHALAGGVALDAAGFQRSTSGIPVLRTWTARDPTRASDIDLRRYVSDGSFSARGVEISVERHSPWVTLALGYRYQHVGGDLPLAYVAEPGPLASASPFASWARPHTLSALVGINAPDPLNQRASARTALWLAFRWESGTAFGTCQDPLALSDAPCESPVLPVDARRLPAARHLDLRFSRRVTRAAYGPRFFVDARNLLNFSNTLRAFRNPASPDVARTATEATELAALQDEAASNGVLRPDGAIDLTFPAAACSTWLASSFSGAAPNCVALRRAEARWGNGDGLYTVAEQRTAIDAWFDATRLTGLHDAPRRIRIGIELGI